MNIPIHTYSYVVLIPRANSARINPLSQVVAALLKAQATERTHLEC